MFEPEVWKMVRTLEREHQDQEVYWRTRLAEERRLARHSAPRGRLRRPGSARTAPTALATFGSLIARGGRILPGRGG